MTDQELKDLVASNAIAITRMNENHQQYMQELRESHQQYMQKLGKLEELLAETIAENAKQKKETEERMKKTDERLDRIGKRLGSMGFNIGLSAEEYFFRDLEQKPTLGNNIFDSVERRIRKNDNDVEHDILLDNGTVTAIIEVKFKAHKDDIKELVTKKLTSYKSRYIIAPHKQLYLGLATMSSNDELEKMAKDYGIYLLTQKGKRLELVNDTIKAY